MLPNRKKIKAELVKFLNIKGPTQSSDCYDYLTIKFDISDEDLELKTNDGESLYKKEIRWAKKDLVDEGTLKKPHASGRGIWELSRAIISTTPPVLCSTESEIDEEVSKLGKLKHKPTGQEKPKKISSSSDRYIRDAAVVAYVLQEANGFCECCSKPSPFFKRNGNPYLEVHHVKQLSFGGSDTIANAIAICPNCHRELHHGSNSDAIIEKLYASIPRLIRE